ncbi:MAG: hypothetical protein MJE77_43110 [Proteobacteria bacterium]|nr:hypothetical protein [Pseudomonadota bacterium]
MLRLLRITAVGGTTIAVAGCVVLVALANDRWVDVDLHPWLAWIVGEQPREAWLPAILAGWLISVLLAGSLLLWSTFYVWRRRQYESLIVRLERELVELRNLPFTEPAPLEDLPEQPDLETARLLAPAGLDADDRIHRAAKPFGTSSHSRSVRPDDQTMGRPGAGMGEDA